MHDALIEFPRSLASYPVLADQTLVELLWGRIAIVPFNAFATVIFLLAVIHTFLAPRFTAASKAMQERHEHRLRSAGQPTTPRFAAEVLHFFGEVEVVF